MSASLCFRLTVISFSNDFGLGNYTRKYPELMKCFIELFPRISAIRSAGNSRLFFSVIENARLLSRVSHVNTGPSSDYTSRGSWRNLAEKTNTKSIFIFLFFGMPLKIIVFVFLFIPYRKQKHKLVLICVRTSARARTRRLALERDFGAFLMIRFQNFHSFLFTFFFLVLLALCWFTSWEEMTNELTICRVTAAAWLCTGSN